jgi:hypothetical protein
LVSFLFFALFLKEAPLSLSLIGKRVILKGIIFWFSIKSHKLISACLENVSVIKREQEEAMISIGRLFLPVKGIM